MRVIKKDQNNEYQKYNLHGNKCLLFIQTKVLWCEQCL